MTTDVRRGLLAIVVALALFAFGAGVGVAVGDSVGIGAEASAHVHPAMPWLARILLVLALAWVFIGMLAARTSLVGRPGAAAARATWLASTRPWRARESTLGMLALDRRLLLIIPGGLLVATRVVQTSLLSWTHLAVILGAWVVFALVVRLLVGERSPYPVMAAVGGVVMLRCIIALAAVSFADADGSWLAFWNVPVLRVVYIAFAVGLFLWALIAAGWAMSAQVGARRATGYVLSGTGVGLAIPALVVAIIGLDHVLATWGDELGLVPWGVLTSAFDVPGASAWYAVGVGVVLAAVGLALALPGRGRAAAS